MVIFNSYLTKPEGTYWVKKWGRWGEFEDHRDNTGIEATIITRTSG
jgi:hypothetical protein